MKRALLIGLMLMMASCQYQSKDLDPTLEGFFPEDAGQTPKPTQLGELQAASGARADAMLHAQHFDGPRLNSLGEDKLSLMLKDDDAPSPMIVYLTIDPKAPTTKARQDAVAAFLKDKGLKAQQIDLRTGPNPESRRPAAKAMAEAEKLHSSGGAGEQGKEGGAMAGAGTAPAK